MKEIIMADKKLAILESAGATREAGAKVIAEAMVATKMTLDKYGEEHIEADHAMRLRAEELRARETGDIKAEASAANNTQINIFASGDEIKALLEMAKDVKGQLAELRTSGRQTGKVIDIG